MQRCGAVFGCVLAFFISSTQILHAAELQPSSSLGTKIDNFTLRDHHGRERSLEDYNDHPLLVVAFLGTECPLAKLYGPRLEELSQEYRDQGVAFLGVNSNRQDSLTKVAAYANRHGVSFPILLDREHTAADQFAAQRTPQVFVLDPSRTVRYIGRIDDQYGISIQRPKPTERDLANALDELLADKPVSVPQTEAVGCFIGRKRDVKPRGEITYSKQIAAIFNRRCVECHREGEIAPFPLTKYDEVLGWEETILEVVLEGRMPPWNADPKHGEFKNDTRLTTEERRLMTTWIQNGCPEGDPADLPPKPEFEQGWRIPQPDRIVKMRNEPFDVAATGVVDYQYFEVDPGFEEDRYVSAVEARPGNRAVVHHIIAYMRPPEAKGKKNLGKILVGYAPGTQPAIYPLGAAIRIPAGWKFIFELHYTPNGSPQQDVSYIGIKFTEKENVKREILGGEAINYKFKIPAGADNYQVTAERQIKKDINLLSLTPHMHLRGKSFRYEAFYPDGKEETLLNVPRYDFNWQLRYELAKPKLLPKGTRLVCTAHFDNSVENPNNPDPTKIVGWGQQSWDEMMIGFYTGVEP